MKASRGGPITQGGGRPLTLYEGIAWAGQAGLVLVAALTLLGFAQHRDGTRRDAALMLGALGMGILVQQLRILIEQPTPWLASLARQFQDAGSQPVAWLPAVSAGLILAHPYLLLRLAARFRPVPKAVDRTVLVGLLLGWAVVVLVPAPLPAPVTLFLVAYFAVPEGYAALQFVRGAYGSSGVASRRMRLAAAGSFCLMATVLLAGVALIAPDTLPVAAASRLLVVASAFAYYLAFSTPSWLRDLWRLPELDGFLRRAAETASRQQHQALLELACASATRATGGVGTMVMLRDNTGPTLRARASDNPRLLSAGLADESGVIGRASYDGRPESSPGVMQLAPGKGGSGLEGETILTAPIQGQEQAWGLLITVLRGGGPFAQDDLAFLQRLATQCAMALDHAAVLEQQRGIARDLETANSELQASQAHFLALFQTAPDSIISADSQGRITGMNQAAEHLFGYPAQEVTGQPLTVLMPDRFKAAHEEGLQRFLATREARVVGRTVELAGKRRDGVEFPIELSLAHWRSGGQDFFTAVLRDVTERKRAEEVQSRLAAIVGSSSDAIIGKTLEGIITSWNPGAEQLYGYTAEEVAGRSISLLIPPENADELPAILERLARGERIDHYETLRISKDGRRIPVSVGIAPVRDASGQIVAAASIARDITERKKAEQALADRSAELEASNRELEAFSYSVSHDLRAPLRAMAGFSRILLEEYSPQLPAQGNRYLTLVRDNAQQMGRLVDDLLAFSRLGRQPVTKQRVDPVPLVYQAIEDLAPAREGREIEFKVEPLPVCQADPALLKQLWLNLLDNAIKYTRTKAPARIEVGAIAGETEPAYYVKDNGVGFDMRYADKLFGVFQRLHLQEEYEGTGVGLAIVQRIVHRHSGRVWAEGTVDQGAAFYFTLDQERMPA